MYKLWMLTAEEISCLETETLTLASGSAAYALALHDQAIHTMVTDCGNLDTSTAERRASSWRYEVSSGTREMTLLPADASSPQPSDHLASPIAQYLVVQHPDAVEAELYLVWGDSRHTRLLKFQDSQWEQLLQPALADHQPLALRRIWKIQDRFYGMGTVQSSPNQPDVSPEIFVCADLDSNSWTSIAYAGFGLPDNGDITGLVEFNQDFYAGISNPHQGFQLWKIHPNNLPTKLWHPVLKQGGARYSWNRDPLALTVWNGALYVLAGTASPATTDRASVPSPELLRVYPDDSWDLIVGTPRFSATGLKVPLAAMGPGFDQPFGAQFQFMTEHGGDLWVALRYQGQIQLWRSQDGEIWTVTTMAELSEPSDWEVSAALSTPAGLAMISHPCRRRMLDPTAGVAADDGLSLPLSRSRQKQTSKTIGAVITNLSSTTENLLKHSHQNLFWFTPDQALHGIFNLGEQEEAQGLALCTSFDTGKQWTLVAQLSGSDPTSTADSCLRDQQLLVAYSSQDSQIVLGRFQYDPNLQSWRFIQTSTIFASDGTKCMVPSLTVDGNNAIWCSFIGQDLETAKYDLRVMYSDDGGISWYNPKLTLSLVNASPTKASRLVALADRVGVIYTDQYVIPEQGVVRTRNWAYRMNNWSIQEPWKTQVLFQHDQAGELREDKAGSHFSAVADHLNNIHLAFQDRGQLMVLKFDYDSQRWQDPIALTDDCKVSFVKVAVSNQQNKVFALGNIRSFAKVFESPLDTPKFESTQFLLHPTGDGLYFSNPRLTAPALVDNKLPVFQQFKTDEVWGAVAFELTL